MCMGTMLLLKELGFELHVATLTQGDGGSFEYSPQEIARIRRSEAEESCRRLGATYHYGGCYDFGIFADDKTNRRVTALFREVDPWLVLTHPPVDYLSDHENTSRLVRNACFYGPVRNYDTGSFSTKERTNRIPYLYYAQPIEGIDLFGNPVAPHCYVDISQQVEKKAELLGCHESQRNWLRAHHGMDEYLESMKRWAGKLGQDASPLFGREVAYAEAFCQHRGHAYPADNVLAQLLPEKVRKA
ncbi:MAG: PIG-L family deacetylase [Acidobacteriota bacterium]|nr:MAG: PIG-L family deacetylase [Acidobacteriota bacterium]